MKSIFHALLLGLALTAFAAPAMAQTTAKPQGNAQSKPKAKAKLQKKAVKDDSPDQAQSTDDDKDVDVASSTAVEMQCAHGDKVTVYENATDNSHIGMRWKKQLLRMHRVETTTGANRFESKRHGLVWIGIPAKGMLLDSKKGLQVANECRSPAQLAALAAPQEPVEPSLLVEARK